MIEGAGCGKSGKDWEMRDAENSARRSREKEAMVFMVIVFERI